MYIIKVNRQSVTKVTSAWHSNTDLASQPTLTILGQTCSGRAWQELSGICLCGLNKKKHLNRYICCIHVMVCYKPFIKYLDSALKKEFRKTERSHVGCYGTWITKRLFWAGAMCAEKPCPCCILSGYVLKCAALSHWCPSAPHAALSHDLKPSFHLCYELKCMFVYIPLFEFFLKSLQRLPSSDGGVIFSADCPAYPQCLVFLFFFLWSAADLSRMCSLGVRLLCRQLGGVISVPFLGHWLCDVPSHWKPLGASHIPALPLQEKPATSPIKPPTTSYTHLPSDLEQSSCIQTSSLTLCTQSPRRCRGETRKDCFLIAGERKKGEGFWNI